MFVLGVLFTHTAWPRTWIVRLLLIATGAGWTARVRWYGVALGGLGLVAMVLHFSRHGLGLGVGGMERLTAFALPVWLLLAGQAVMRSMTKGPGR